MPGWPRDFSNVFSSKRLDNPLYLPEYRLFIPSCSGLRPNKNRELFWGYQGIEFGYPGTLGPIFAPKLLRFPTLSPSRLEADSDACCVLPAFATPSRGDDCSRFWTAIFESSKLTLDLIKVIIRAGILLSPIPCNPSALAIPFEWFVVPIRSFIASFGAPLLSIAPGIAQLFSACRIPRSRCNFVQFKLALQNDFPSEQRAYALQVPAVQSTLS